ncbi:protein CpxP [Malonomonas rubra DSM 5091]|uniref:Protein CpxP n=1 Tax=Malonomonas rubra DSM 5091 TaxID=1122189 RepID=A0A1M6IPQ9_MALRU|nr:Spy/CpxP family protein refolding chaperone [Malonomonas rubra]SHJ36454.1 protein CpxP [Malonomonas rubra DSM 5091]
MKKQVLIPALLIGTLVTSSIAMAAPGFGKFRSGDCDGNGKGRQAITFEQHEERAGQRLEKMTAILDLSEEQQAQVKQLLNNNWQERQDGRSEMQAARDAMREARQAEPFNEGAFRTAVAELNELKTDKMVERAQQKEELFALLTPEQQEKAETLRGLMSGPGKGKHGGGKGFRL